MNSMNGTLTLERAGTAFAMPKITAVGMSEMAISCASSEILTVLGLGSCVAIAAYHRKTNTGILLHAVLPKYRPGGPRTRFVDTGIEEMMQMLIQQKVSPQTCEWWLSGGARMLSVPGGNDPFQIGVHNVETATLLLRQHGLHPKAQHTGGNLGRTVRLYVADGSFTVRLAGSEERQLVA
jgi:chemotaxis protein CheD